MPLTEQWLNYTYHPVYTCIHQAMVGCPSAQTHHERYAASKVSVLAHPISPACIIGCVSFTIKQQWFVHLHQLIQAVQFYFLSTNRIFSTNAQIHPRRRIEALECTHVNTLPVWVYVCVYILSTELSFTEKECPLLPNLFRSSRKTHITPLVTCLDHQACSQPPIPPWKVGTPLVHSCRLGICLMMCYLERLDLMWGRGEEKLTQVWCKCMISM